ncbi:MAG: phosphotransferase [Thermodesulfobacteriota bacterium]
MSSLERAARKALDHYDLDRADRLVHLSAGRVNLTFLVESSGERFILQRLHPVFGLDGAVAENAAAAAAALTRTGLAAPLVVPAKDGRPFAEEDGIWRLVVHLPGRTYSERTVWAGAECGRYLGLVHRALGQDPPPLKPLPPADYGRETPWPAEAWERLITAYSTHPDFGPAAAALELGRDLVAKWPVISIETKGPVHGDPKLENFLFDQAGKALAVIDLDTVQIGSLAWDLADGLRSWAGRREADDTVVLDRDIIAAGVRSYHKHGPRLSPGEWRTLPAAVGAKALNLAFRYLRDSFEQSYFAWDRIHYPSPAAQNRSRGRGLLALAGRLSGTWAELAEEITPG